MTNESMRIGAVAAAAGVNIQTLRYYERRGLLPPPKRSASGQRGYIREALGMLVDSCECRNGRLECPIIEALDEPHREEHHAT